MNTWYDCRNGRMMPTCVWWSWKVPGIKPSVLVEIS